MTGLKLDVYVITDSRYAGERGNLAVIQEAIAGGADVVQLREKEMSGARLYDLGLQLRKLTREAGVIFIVNDRVDLALAVDADGVHVGQDDLPASVARRLVGSGKIVGVSASNLDEALGAMRQGADYLGVGPLYATGTKLDAGAPVGLDVIGEIKRATGLPVVGIGGINASNVGDVMRAGADGVAVISAVIGSPDPREAMRAIRAALGSARRER